MKKLLIAPGIIVLIYFSARIIVSPYIESLRNLFKVSSSYSVTTEALAVYGRLDFISDLHFDAQKLLRELDQVDFTRIKANAAMEMFTIVSKSPDDANVKRFFL